MLFPHYGQERAATFGVYEGLPTFQQTFEYFLFLFPSQPHGLLLKGNKMISTEQMEAQKHRKWKDLPKEAQGLDSSHCHPDLTEENH